MQRGQRLAGLAPVLAAWVAGCGPHPVVLAGPRDGVAHPYGLAADADRLYWTERGRGGAIRSCRKAGGGLATLARGVARYAWFCAVDDTHVYWTEFDTGLLRRVPKAGGAVDDWERGLENPGQLVIARGAVWWVEYGGNVIKRRGVRDVRATVVAGGLQGPQALLVDEEAVYWTEFADPPRLVRRPHRGGAAVRLAEVSPECWLVRAGPHLWWTETRGSVRRCAAAGGPVASLAPILGGGGAFAATDGASLYWAEEFGGRLLRLPAGATGPDVLLTGLRHPAVMAADAAAVYWADPEADAIFRFTVHSSESRKP